jgi:hypothetical protein
MSSQPLYKLTRPKTKPGGYHGHERPCIKCGARCRRRDEICSVCHERTRFNKVRQTVECSGLAHAEWSTDADGFPCDRCLLRSVPTPRTLCDHCAEACPDWKQARPRAANSTRRANK